MKIIDTIETKWINSFKGIAIIGIVLVHFGIKSIDNKWFSFLVYYGAKGVYIFALVTAYLMYYSLDKNEVDNMKKAGTWLVSKIIRLIPLYYLAIVVYLIVEGTGNRWWLGSLPKISILNVVSHFLFLHGFNPYYCNSILGVEWYIGVLFMLYLIAPFLHKFVNNFRRSVMFFMVSLIVCNYYLKLSDFRVIADDYIWSYFVENFTLISLLPLVSLGIVLYYGINSVYFKQIIGNKASSFFCIFFFLFIIYRLMRGSNFYGLSTAGFWGMALSGIIISQVIFPNKLLCNSIFATLGKYSYGIFLFHYLLINHVPEIPIKNVYFSWIVNYGIILCLSLGVAVLLDKFIEKPILNKCSIRRK